MSGPLEVRAAPDDPDKSFGINAPLNFTLPATSNFSVGQSVPTPTFCALVNAGAKINRMRSIFISIRFSFHFLINTTDKDAIRILPGVFGSQKVAVGE